jgi:hypothetical protein
METPKANIPVAGQKRQDSSAKELIDAINSKFMSLGDQLVGLMNFTQQALKKVERELRSQSVRISVQDVAATSLVKILLKKGIMTEEEYKEVAQSTYSEAMDKEDNKDKE